MDNNGQVSWKNVDILSPRWKIAREIPPPPLHSCSPRVQDDWKEPFVYRFLSKTSDSLSKARQRSVEKVTHSRVRREKVTPRRRSRIVDQRKENRTMNFVPLFFLSLSSKKFHIRGKFLSRKITFCFAPGQVFYSIITYTRLLLMFFFFLYINVCD